MFFQCLGTFQVPMLLGRLHPNRWVRMGCIPLANLSVKEFALAHALSM